MSGQVLFERDLPAQHLVHLALPGRIEEDSALAWAEPVAKVEGAGKVGGGAGSQGCVPLDRGSKSSGIDPLVRGDRRHREHHSGPKRGCNQLERTEACTGPIQLGPLIRLEAALAGAYAHPAPAQIGGRHPVDENLVHREFIPTRTPPAREGYDLSQRMLFDRQLGQVRSTIWKGPLQR
jgi:hypothetical protein